MPMTATACFAKLLRNRVKGVALRLSFEEVYARLCSACDEWLAIKLYWR